MPRPKPKNFGVDGKPTADRPIPSLNDVLATQTDIEDAIDAAPPLVNVVMPAEVQLPSVPEIPTFEDFVYTGPTNQEDGSSNPFQPQVVEAGMGSPATPQVPSPVPPHPAPPPSPPLPSPVQSLGVSTAEPADPGPVNTRGAGNVIPDPSSSRKWVTRVEVLDAYQYDGRTAHAPTWINKDWLSYNDGPILAVPQPGGDAVHAHVGDWIVHQVRQNELGVPMNEELTVYTQDSFRLLFREATA